ALMPGARASLQYVRLQYVRLQRVRWAGPAPLQAAVYLSLHLQSPNPSILTPGFFSSPQESRDWGAGDTLQSWPSARMLLLGYTSIVGITGDTPGYSPFMAGAPSAAARPPRRCGWRLEAAAIKSSRPLRNLA